MTSLQDFYKNKKVFVTGHTGFKGSWLSLLLKELGSDVTGYALAPEINKDSLFRSSKIDGLKNAICQSPSDTNSLTAI